MGSKAFEPSLEVLAARYESESESEKSETTVEPSLGAQAPSNDSLKTSLTEALFGDLRHAAVQEQSDDEDEDDEDDEIASALAWADFQDDQLARGNAVTAAGSSRSLASALRRPNAQGGAMHRVAKALPAATAGNVEHLGSKFHAGSVEPGRLTTGVSFAPIRMGKGTGAGPGSRTGAWQDRANRATVEQVLDPRTRMVLFKMLNRGVFSEINGVVSTGKEANVYHASDPSGLELAIKIYKTSILVFRDRERYVAGDSRFQRFCKSNPRKMVKLWAEKEMRNLLRLIAAGIRAPKPLQLRLHVLTMEFIGSGGVAAPRLKDANLPPSRMRQAYTEMVLIVRSLYHKARLVHADLSEYNILVHENELFIIDVSQSVELDHPRAFDFLREDCLHVNDYFRRQGVATLTVKELFDFAVDPAVNDDNLDETLEALMAVAASRPIDVTADVAEAVWAQAFIPKKLEEVANYERDHDRLQEGGGDSEGIYYQALAGMNASMTGIRTVPLALEQKDGPVKVETGKVASSSSPSMVATPQPERESTSTKEGNDVSSSAHHHSPAAPEGQSDDASSSTGASDDNSEDEGWVPGKPHLTREEIRAARKQHQKEVKEGNRERRKNKMPKKEKAKKMAKSKNKKK